MSRYIKNLNFKKLIHIKAENLLSFYLKVLAVLSALSPPSSRLTELEMDCLARFLSLPSEYDHFPFSPKGRKLVCRQMEPEITIQTISARLSSLISKGYLTRDEDGYVSFSPSVKKLRHIQTLDVKIQITAPD